jgi:hypothetical protein
MVRITSEFEVKKKKKNKSQMSPKKKKKKMKTGFMVMQCLKESTAKSLPGLPWVYRRPILLLRGHEHSFELLALI